MIQRKEGTVYVSYIRPEGKLPKAAEEEYKDLDDGSSVRLATPEEEETFMRGEDLPN